MHVFIITTAEREDPDEMLQNVAFQQGQKMFIYRLYNIMIYLPLKVIFTSALLPR